MFGLFHRVLGDPRARLGLFCPAKTALPCARER
jgi:hypothetical protein